MRYKKMYKKSAWAEQFFYMYLNVMNWLNKQTWFAHIYASTTTMYHN